MQTVAELIRAADTSPSMFGDELVSARRAYSGYIRWIAHLVGLDMIRWDAERRRYITDMRHGGDFEVERDAIWMVLVGGFPAASKARALLKHST